MKDLKEYLVISPKLDKMPYISFDDTEAFCPFCSKTLTFNLEKSDYICDCEDYDKYSRANQKYLDLLKDLENIEFLMKSLLENDKINNNLIELCKDYHKKKLNELENLHEI